MRSPEWLYMYVHSFGIGVRTTSYFVGLVMVATERPRRHHDCDGNDDTGTGPLN